MLMKTKSALCILLLCHTFFIFSQTSWKGTTSTVWTTSSNWTAGVPTSTIDAIIGDANFTGAFQPALTSGSPACKSLTIGADTKASTLTIGKNFTVYGTINIGANGTILHNTANRIISLKGNWVNTGVYNATVSTAGVTFSGPGQSITGATTFRTMTVNSGSIVTLNTNIVVNTKLSVTGTIDPTENYSITGTGTLVANSKGTLRVKAANFTTNYGISGTVTLSGTSTVNYTSSTINQNVSNAYTYGYLRISGGMTKTLTGNLPGLSSASSSSGRIYIDAGIFDLLTYTANRNTAGGIITIASLAQLRIGGTNTFPNYTTKTITSTSTVEYYGTNQTITAAAYGNLTFSSSNGAVVKTMPVTALTIAGNFTSYVGAGTSVTFTAGNSITVNKDVSLDAGSIFNASSYTHNFLGGWINNGTFNGATSSAVFKGVNAALSGTGTNNFYNLTFSASGINADAATSINVAGNLATSGPGIFTHAANGTLTMSGTGKVITGNGFSLANCTLSGTITTSANITISGNLTVNGSFAASAGTVTLSGVAKSISGSSTITFFSLNIFGTITTAKDFIVLGNFSVSIACSFTSSAGTATFNGTTSVLSGTAYLFHVTINASKTLGLGTNSILGIAGTFTKTGTLNVTTSIPNTVEYNASGAQSIVNTTYSNLVLANGGTKTAAGAITVNNDFTINASVTFNAVSYIFTLYRHFTSNGIFTQPPVMCNSEVPMQLILRVLPAFTI
jgi:fibronectin-binding autotransporter adhesin